MIKEIPMSKIELKPYTLKQLKDKFENCEFAIQEIQSLQIL